jgi:hypothetical protein
MPPPNGRHLMNLRHLAKEHQTLATYYHAAGYEDAAQIEQKRSVLYQGKALAEELRLRDVQEQAAARPPATRR